MVLRPLTRKRSDRPPRTAAEQGVYTATPPGTTAATRESELREADRLGEARSADDQRSYQGDTVARWQDEPVPDGSGERVPLVHRAGAIGIAIVIGVFGILGFADNLDFFSTEGGEVLGLSSNGLLSAISIVTAAVLIFSAFRSPRTASTIMLVIGILFLLSALVNLAVLRTDFNFLAFEMPNVFFSIAAGLVLLTLGAYGRLSGHLPPDSPYAHEDPETQELRREEPELFPETPEEFAAEAAMREAEIAVVQHRATEEQRRRVEAMSHVTTRQDRRRVWMDFDARRR